jgi:hypothetical protein
VAYQDLNGLSRNESLLQQSSCGSNDFPCPHCSIQDQAPGPIEDQPQRIHTAARQYDFMILYVKAVQAIHQRNKRQIRILAVEGNDVGVVHVGSQDRLAPT